MDSFIGVIGSQTMTPMIYGLQNLQMPLWTPLTLEPLIGNLMDHERIIPRRALANWRKHCGPVEISVSKTSPKMLKLPLGKGVEKFITS